MNKFRSHNCAELSEKDSGKDVALSGWLHRKRDHGGLLFIDLRDHFGLTQLVFDPDSHAFQKAEKVRGDEICWITGSSSEGALWLSWCEAMQQYVNRSLFMGLFSFESHFACYEPGKFYKRHVDAFKGQGNRVLSLVAYLNDDWTSEDGGELVLYADESDLIGTRVLPTKGTFVVFLSEQFPHEVLPAARSRHSVAGWFRVNGSVNDAIDPPR